VPPAILFGLVLATLYGSGFHLVFGRRLWQWPIFWIAAVIGFFGGYAAGELLGLDVLRLGVLPLAACSVGSALVLAVAWFFSTPTLGQPRSISDEEP